MTQKYRAIYGNDEMKYNTNTFPKCIALFKDIKVYYHV